MNWSLTTNYSSLFPKSVNGDSRPDFSSLRIRRRRKRSSRSYSLAASILLQKQTNKPKINHANHFHPYSTFSIDTLPKHAVPARNIRTAMANTAVYRSSVHENNEHNNHVYPEEY